MKLRSLFEDLFDGAYAEPKLNMLTTPEEDVRAAFDMMEFDGFYDQSRRAGGTRIGDVTINGWFKAYQRRKEQEKESLEEIEDVKAGRPSQTPDIHASMTRNEILENLVEEYEREFGPEARCGGQIYGSGGWNRYGIRFGGGIWFSAQHAAYPAKKTIQNAIDLGFGVF